MLQQAEELTPRVEPTATWLGMYPGWPKRAFFMTLALAPFVGALFSKLAVCPTAAMFHIPCPGCGLTCATLAALHGHFSEAFHLHPLVFFATPIYLGVIGSLAWGYVRGGRHTPPSKRWGKIVTGLAIALFVSLFTVWVARFFGAFGGPVPLTV